ncbi:hypothetical protein KY290_024686 [Solanum tuberosum]|uniref:DUF1985 domain-containing protein n=1 Tax=Solanum tuberosum TaxID=4113 RepID=A0ABQ7UTE0_SOLTU|nr:hypothetical protein KY284_023533 [Solanum tuberosum]KAH0754416.1 hypothetical protein KY290_024686 [Solanum tuberosum]
MAKTRGGSTKSSAPIASSIKKRKAEKVLKTCKKKKIALEEPESDSEMEQWRRLTITRTVVLMKVIMLRVVKEKVIARRVVEMRKITFPICARDISDELYDLATWLDEVGSFLAKISGTCFGHLRHIPDYFKFNGQIVHYILLRWPTCFGLKEFALITRLNCSAYARESKMNKVLRKGENFHFKVTKNKNITSTKLISLIKSNKLNKEQKLKSYLVRFVHSMLLTPDWSKILDSNHIKMADDLDFFNSYPWGKESFDLTLTYLKNLINLRKQREIWYTSKSDNIVEGDPFKYKGRSTMFVHPYLTPTVREMEQNYMATFQPYTDEVKDAAINVLKAQFKGVTILTSRVQSADDEYLDDHNIVQP